MCTPSSSTPGGRWPSSPTPCSAPSMCNTIWTAPRRQEELSPLTSAPRAAALTTQLINAQTSLYNAQFQMTTIWITYLNTRLQLYRDMELMPLDYRGVWIDETDSRECPSSAADGQPRRDQGGSGGE